MLSAVFFLLKILFLILLQNSKKDVKMLWFTIFYQLFNFIFLLQIWMSVTVSFIMLDVGSPYGYQMVNMLVQEFTFFSVLLLIMLNMISHFTFLVWFKISNFSLTLKIIYRKATDPSVSDWYIEKFYLTVFVEK